MMPSCYIVVRTKSNNDALVRLQSDPLIGGLQQRSGVTARVSSPTACVDICNNAVLIFHYDDSEAAAAVRSIKRRQPTALAAAMGSDIISFGPYLSVQDIVDFYVMPTELHRQLLSSQVYKPVYVLQEGLDPIAQGSGSKPFPDKVSKRLMWFGYPESFDKGMASLVPVLQLNLTTRSIESFQLIVGTQAFRNRFQLAAIPFSTDTFADTAADFDYCVLSHFPLDLAINSYIKSPNKLLTALVAGLIPIASRTPSYERVLGAFGLQRFLYESPVDLNRILKRLDPVVDSRAVRESGIVEAIADRHSEKKVADRFCEIVSEFSERDPADTLSVSPAIIPTHPVKMRLSEHVRDLIPSTRRALEWRVRRARTWMSVRVSHDR